MSSDFYSDLVQSLHWSLEAQGSGYLIWDAGYANSWMLLLHLEDYWR